MPFDQSTISDVSHIRFGTELLIRWDSTSPTGTVFQVYLARRLAWKGVGRSCLLPWPSQHGSNIPIDVGTVGGGEATIDFASSLPAAPAHRASLTWLGGTYLSDSIAGFRIYSSTAPGGAVDYTTVLADVPAYPGGLILDGFGLAGFGQGGFGRAPSSYSWTSRTLASGTWTFAVQPHDLAGNASGSPLTQNILIAAPPQPPAANSRGVRLTYTFSTSTKQATLSWLASPG